MNEREASVLVLTLINVGILIANIVLLGLSLKLYTEYFKDRSQANRKPTP